MFYIFCVLITFPSSTYYVCGTVGVDLCHVQSCDFSPKNREPPTPKTQFLHTRNAAITSYGDDWNFTKRRQRSIFIPVTDRRGFFSITCIANLPHNLVPDIGNLSTTPHTHWFSAMTAFWQFYIPNTLAIAVFALYPHTNGSWQLQPLLYSAQKLVSGNDSLGSISHKLVTCNNCQFYLTVLTILRPKVDNFLTDRPLSFL